MPPVVLALIFEPFFTTKQQGDGEGKGLGLSFVDAIVKRHRGIALARSEEGKGTVIEILLPSRMATSDNR